MMAAKQSPDILEEAIRLKALGNSLQALAILAEEHEKEINLTQVEEIGKMVCELTLKIQEKLEA
jgi:hypothetical protein